MSRLEKLRELARRGATEGEREAARLALRVHEERLLARPEVVSEPPGPDLARRGGRPFAATVVGGEVLVPVRDGEEAARAWVAERRRMKVKVRGRVMAVVPTSVTVDDADGAWVCADAESLEDWDSRFAK